ncbi:MAG TPA: GTPase, partial [Arthrobacter sp.]|nr:GTPase [Arthrobacter sp.]
MSRHGIAAEDSRLDRRLDALNEARELAAGALPEDVLDGVLQVLDRAGSRRSLSADHTVVGFFGATGSGKSSLFNAVSGAEIATAAARRPTTSEPLAGIWGAEGSDELLDWLEVRNRHHATPVPGFADEGTGLILLDLPDFDSTRAANREIVERMVGLVDVLVWVLDPQKYADAAVHNDFLTPLASHGAVTLVVLNQVDRLPAHEVGPVLESLKSILARDGLGKVQVIGASAVAGTGVDKVRAAIRQVALQRRAQSQRLGADVTRAAARLAEASGPGEAPGVKATSRARLTEELAVAANVPVVVDAVVRSYQLESTRRTGWPVTRWLVRFRPDPLRRLNLRREGARPDLNRTSLPPAG